MYIGTSNTLGMKKTVTFCLSLLFALSLQAQSNRQLSATWIEVEKTSSGILELSLYQQFASVDEPTALEVSLDEYFWNPVAQNFGASANRAGLVLPLHSSFTTLQNLYYPNCEPWISSQECIPQRILVYRASFPAPLVGADTALLRYTYSTTGVKGVQNAPLSDSITAFCYTDFIYLPNQSSNLHSPKIAITESWHRYLPIYWPKEPGNGTFINSYLPFRFTSSSPLFVGFDQLWVDFVPEDAQLIAADSFWPAHADSNFHIFIRPTSPIQLGIRNLMLTNDSRWANPLLFWNQVGPGYRNAAHLFLVGNVQTRMSLGLEEGNGFGTMVRLELYDLLGRLLYEGGDLTDFTGDRHQVLLLREFDAQDRMRVRKIKLVD